MRREELRNRSPHWRTLLEARWRARLEEVTELSLAYHIAAEGSEDKDEARRVLHRAVVARQGLAETEEALRRLAAGDFGRCERCGAGIPATSLLAAPESRYCPRCAAASAPSRLGETPELTLGMTPSHP